MIPERLTADAIASQSKREHPKFWWGALVFYIILTAVFGIGLAYVLTVGRLQ